MVPHGVYRGTAGLLMVWCHWVFKLDPFIFPLPGIQWPLKWENSEMILIWSGACSSFTVSFFLIRAVCNFNHELAKLLSLCWNLSPLEITGENGDITTSRQNDLCLNHLENRASRFPWFSIHRVTLVKSVGCSPVIQLHLRGGSSELSDSANCSASLSFFHNL